MAILIQQLWDVDLERPVRVADADSSKLVYDEEVSVRDADGTTHRYRLYTPRGDTPPYQNDRAHYKDRYKNKENQPPFRLYRLTEENERVPDRESIAHQLATRWGGGCFLGYYIGGYPPLEYFWRQTWLQEVA